MTPSLTDEQAQAFLQQLDDAERSHASKPSVSSPPNSMTLKLTSQQAQSFMQLADAAVRAGGLQFARQAVELMNAIDAAAAAANDTPHHEDQSDA